MGQNERRSLEVSISAWRDGVTLGKGRGRDRVMGTFQNGAVGSWGRKGQKS